MQAGVIQMASLSPAWTRNRYILSGLAILGALLAAWWLLSPVAPAASTTEPGAVGEVTGGFAERGRAAPGFALATLDGGRLSLQELSGRPVLMNFWATWCPPCRAEIPHLVSAYEKYGDEGLEILAVDLQSDVDPDAVRAFAQEFGMTFPILLDSTGSVERAYLVRGYPTSIFIGRDGVIERIHWGPMTGGQVQEFIGEIL